jgi:hypothetical protein
VQTAVGLVREDQLPKLALTEKRPGYISGEKKGGGAMNDIDPVQGDETDQNKARAPFLNEPPELTDPNTKRASYFESQIKEISELAVKRGVITFPTTQDLVRRINEGCDPVDDPGTGLNFMNRLDSTRVSILRKPICGLRV